MDAEPNMDRTAPGGGRDGLAGLLCSGNARLQKPSLDTRTGDPPDKLRKRR